MMKVGIFVGEDCARDVQELLRALERRDVRASAFKLSRAWPQAHTDEIRHNFATITHAVLFLSRACINASWFPFVAGYFIGRDLNIVLYNGGTAPPRFLESYNHFSKVQSLADFLEQELTISQKTRRVEDAQAELSAAGYLIDESSFARSVDQGDADAVRNFLRVGMSPDIRDDTGVPILSHAIRQGFPEVVHLLIQHGADVNAVSEDRGNSPIMEAATRGDLKTVKVLIQSGADPNLRTQYDQTALMLAIGEGHANVAEFLLENGAETHHVDYLGMTAEKYAKLFRSDQIISLLEKADS